MKFAAYIIALSLIIGVPLGYFLRPRVDTYGAGQLMQTRDDETVTMTMVIVSASQIERKCQLLGAGTHRNGCTTFDNVTKHCTMYVMPQRFPFDSDRLEIIGHETWHCRFGVWHPEE